jgi:hypothetical protein
VSGVSSWMRLATFTIGSFESTTDFDPDRVRSN